MKKVIPFYIIIILSFYSSVQCFGRSNTIDSLLNVLDNSSDSIKASTFYQIGELNYKKEDYSSSIKYLKKSVQFDLKDNNLKAISNTLNLIGNSYIKQGSYDDALKNYLVSLKLSKYQNDNNGIARALNNIGRHYGMLNDYKKSLNYHLRALKIIDLLENNIEIRAKSLNNIGTCYGYLGEVDKSLEYFSLSLPLRYEIGNKEDISILINNIGYAYSLKGDYDKALEQFNLSLKICEEINDNKGTTYALLNVAELYITQKKYPQAIPILLKSLKLAQKINVDFLILDSYRFLSKSYTEIGDNKKALYYLQKFNKIQEELFHKKIKNKVGNVKLLSELKAKEQEVNQLSKEKEITNLQLKSNQNFIFSLLILLFTLSVFFIIFYFQKRQLKKANNTLVFKNLEIVENEIKLKKAYDGLSITENKSNNPLIAKSEPTKYVNSPLSQEQKDDILDKILDEIEKNQLFLQDDLTLIMLSDIINTNKSYISQIINEKFEKNFSTFINEYRIVEARKLLSQKENWILTIEAIANSVGFKSISAFNSAFKKFTGITPSYFIDTVKSNEIIH